MTVNYVYLGYGTTDENGECKLDHDANGDSISHSYTGTGAGKIDVVASLDSPSSISDSSLVSETFVVYDCIFKDIGTTSSSNNRWQNLQQTLTISVESDGTLVSNDSNAFGVRYADKDESGSSIYDFTVPFCVEFDCVSISGEGMVYIYDGTNTKELRSWSSLQLTNNSHLKVIVSNQDVRYYINNNATPIITSSNQLGNSSVGLRVNPNASIKYKNFMIYPI